MYLEPDELYESDEEESEKNGSGLESGSFGKFSTGLGGLLSGV